MSVSPGDIHVLSWNLFHGQDGARLGPSLGSILFDRPIDDGTHVHLNRKWTDEMAAVIVARSPTFTALQEVSPQAVDRLAQRTGRRAARSLMRPLIGPTRLRGWLADRNPDLWRTHEGTANVILVDPDWDIEDEWTVRHNPACFALRMGRRLTLGWRERLHWLLEPRRCVVARCRHRHSESVVTVVSLHCHNSLDWSVIAAEVARVLPKVVDRMPDGEPVIVAGDFNAAGAHHPALEVMHSAGFTEDSTDDLDLDHIFHRGLDVLVPPRALRRSVRTLRVMRGDTRRSVLLSDHDPVEAVYRIPSD